MKYLWTIIFVFSLALAFLLGRASIHRTWRSFGSSASSEQDQIAGFDDFVKIWNAYVIKNDGFIPRDPYRGLVDSGVIESYADFYGIIFDSSLPPRINPSLSKNPRRAVFRQLMEEYRQVWTCYADGTWSRLDYSQDGQDQDDWRHAMEAAGYPSWQTMREKDEWIAKNRDKLVWDASMKMYVLPNDSHGR